MPVEFLMSLSFFLLAIVCVVWAILWLMVPFYVKDIRNDIRTLVQQNKELLDAEYGTDD